MLVEPVPFGSSDALDIPDGVNNWTYFDGSLLTVLIRDSGRDTAMGTAVMVAPGLAVTATHVLSDHLDALLEGQAAILCAGPTQAGLDIWDVLKVSMSDDDIAFLSLSLASEISTEWRVRTLPLTTRAPAPGEQLHVVGFRFEATRDTELAVALEGTLFASVGEVVAVYYPLRDRVLMPFPTIEISCGALGGMSGGAVLDSAGHVVGVVSRGLDTEDGRGQTFAAWIVGGLNRKVEIPWPPGVYEQPVHLLSVDHRLINIEGRNKINILDENRYTYEIWFERE